MGQDHSSRRKSSSQDSAVSAPEKMAGKIAVSGRYHRLPKRIEDDYEMTDKVLGSGYNGVVRMAVNKGATNPQKFAVKAFKLVNLDTEKKRQLESEVDVFLGLDHPHVTRLLDVYETDQYLHLVMECMEGGELFDRVKEKKRFSEHDAADAVRQMLLAVNYLHSHGIVHRDLKLENFLFDWKSSSHLKLIDFGFSKVWDPNIKMQVSCGTLAYVAPEVLRKSYDHLCDMWSLGVITFILLSGYMPFSGSEAVQTQNIIAGKYTMKPERWNNISSNGKDFVKHLLQTDSSKRLTAEKALNHPWIKEQTMDRRNSEVVVDDGIVDALREFGKAAKFKRCCLEMMAWSLSNEERSKVREYFVAMDKNQQGTITLGELKQVLDTQFHVPEGEVSKIFEALDSNHDETIHYSDFLAAMLSSRIAIHGDLLRNAFKRFDTDNSGYITVENLREVLGDSFEGEEVEDLIKDADQLKDGRISYEEFVSYLRGTPLDKHAQAAAKVIDREASEKERTGRRGSWAGVPMLQFIGRVGSKEKSGAQAHRNGKNGSKDDSKGKSQQKSCCAVM